MQKMKMYLLLLATVFLVFACTSKNSSDSDPPANNNYEENEASQDENDAIHSEVEYDKNIKKESEPSSKTESMSDFFLPTGSKAHYKGEGIEFAELDIVVTILEDKYAIVDEDNGGVTIRTMYVIQNDKIELLSNEPIDLKEPIPPIETIAKLTPIEVYLQKPFEVGATFGDWTITEIKTTVETPLKKFNDAIVIESEDEDFINRKYFVRNYGEVKRESIMKKEENEDFIVTSTLESIQ